MSEPTPFQFTPRSVRYVKNGPGGRWWKAAYANGQLHGGWAEVPPEILKTGRSEDARPYIEALFNARGGAKAAISRDVGALRELIERPSQHVWVTFEDRRMWWCTVRDEIGVQDGPDDTAKGHFWLTCDRPWSDRSIDGTRQLVMSELPGPVAALAGYRATVCNPSAAADILRVIRNEEAPHVIVAREARRDYREALEGLITGLGDRDFELLVELILARDGWVRTAASGGSGADLDVEVENRSAGELAFVQVKSRSDQAQLDDYVTRFERQRDRYARMIFAVHSPAGPLKPPASAPIQVWDRPKLADLSLRLGLGDWIERRL